MHGYELAMGKIDLHTIRGKKEMYYRLRGKKKSGFQFAVMTRFVLRLLILFAISQTARAGIIYGDGQHHIISTSVEEDIIVVGYARVNEPFRSTTVDIVHEGKIGGDVTVGSFGFVNVAGGSIQGNVGSIADGGGIYISSGAIQGSVEVTGVTSLHISSAHIGGNVYYGKSYDKFSITDSVIAGDVTTAAARSSISNTTIHGILRSVIAPKMVISDCSLYSGIEASSYSVFSLKQCGITGNITVNDHSVLIIRGNGFKVNGVDFVSGNLSPFYSGEVTGLSATGRLIDFDFTINDYAEIILIPEPSALILLGMGGLFLRKKI